METKKGRISMTIKEIDRLQLIERVCRKEIKLNKAAKLLGISNRQAIRIKKRFLKEGCEGIVSKKVGARSNNQLLKEKKDLVLNFLRKEDQSDFGPLLVHEYLSKEHGNFMSLSSVRRIMVENHIWGPRKTKSKKIYRLRQRKEQRGELIQVDGSEHDWFEGRGPRCTLLVYIDDATNESFARFVKSENTWDYLHTTREYIEIYGRPIAFYSDKHSVFRVNREGALTGDGTTQYGRAMKELGIELICANSPQAKGRVERKNRDFQNRLVKAMRLARVSTLEEANTFLPSFLQELNHKFAKLPKTPTNAHKAITETQDLDKIFCIKHARKVSKSLTLQYGGVLYQIYADRMEYTLRGKNITILEYADGRIEFDNQGQILRAVPYKEVEAPAEVVSSKELAEQARSCLKKKVYKPSSRHPWKQGGRRKQPAMSI